MIGDIATTGPTAPPRRNGELVFDAPWEGRAFGLTVALLEREGLGWDAFRPHLVRAIEADPDHTYYEQLAVALDAFVAERGLL
ncbi:MAG TPA: hypothetical protein VM262_02110 [Acidimicrobiales bacterium]|nr:hypothetical protein [Acidimicrobiales bacterium]